ncbi:uncharacterized protein LOC127751229 [Frankliniella occidentalis]|uniref:Uncharacterized protein LOC127751229 n=1 Tax=Frankliniella occidentalis TaxID=133901 RepID=A0A9C6X792_FRAOC|nr:uncharacterized protein LOC127751229 [Frankliniella occidentalis]
MGVYEYKGCLFECSPPGTSVAHCVSANLRCGRGFARLCRGQDFADLRRQQVRVGGVAVGWQDGRQIFNLVTKKHHTDIPTLWAIRESLYELRRLCYMHGVRDICSPALASGLDTHNWVTIREMLHDIFWNCDINIHVYHL